MTKKLVSYNDGVSAGSRLPGPVHTEISLYITAAFNALIAGAPGALDTWLELTAAIQADQTGLAALTTVVGAKVPNSLVDAKGDLLVGTADNTVGRLAVGSNTQVLMADSAQSGGVKWTDTLVNPTIKNYTEAVVVIGNSGTAKTIDLTNGTAQTCTLTGHCTFTMPAVVAGKSFLFQLNTGAGGFTAAFTGVKWPAGTAPTITTAASRMDLLSFASPDGANWYGTIAQNFTP